MILQAFKLDKIRQAQIRESDQKSVDPRINNSDSRRMVKNNPCSDRVVRGSWVIPDVLPKPDGERWKYKENYIWMRSVLLEHFSENFSFCVFIGPVQ